MQALQQKMKLAVSSLIQGGPFEEQAMLQYTEKYTMNCTKFTFVTIATETRLGTQNQFFLVGKNLLLHVVMKESPIEVSRFLAI